MEYAECREGLRVREKDTERVGKIVGLHPVLNIAGRVPPGSPSIMFNMVSVEWEPPYEITPIGAVKGTIFDPRMLVPAFN